MTSVQLSDLDLATVANDADLALIRKSDTTDYKITVALLRNINIPGLPNLSPTANSPLINDLFMLSRAGINSQCQFGAVGFTVGTRIWFHMNAEPVSPIYWQIVQNTGDTLLAVRGGATYTTGGGSTQGTWQQTGWAITEAQMPTHSHTFITYESSSGSNLVQNKVSSTNRNTGLPTRTDQTGGGQAHNHGNTWRPSASVGIICQKFK